MRKLTYSMLTSLDLYIEGPDGHFGWAMPDPELHSHFNRLAAVTTTHLYGRRMWETMSGYWPNAASEPDGTPETYEFAKYWNAGEHIVFSRTLRSVGHGATLCSTDAIQEVRRLKASDGPDMDVGGAGLASALIAAGLVDEIHAYINPVVLGGGKRFIDVAQEAAQFVFLGLTTFSGGVVQLRYTPL